MRWVGWILVVLLAVAWLAVELPPLVASKPPNDQGLWRRTRNGWERADWLLPQPAPPPFGVHPAGLSNAETGQGSRFNFQLTRFAGLGR